MEAYYQTLSAIYDIVKSDPSPHTYLCTPQAIILRHTQDWASIQKHLEVLAFEQFITIKQLDKMVICITPDGITKAKSIKNNFINKNFSFSQENKTDFITNDQS